MDTDTEVRIEAADRNFVILEALLIAIFLATLAFAGTIGRVLGIWLVLWVVVLIGLGVPLLSRSAIARRWPTLAGPVLALLGVLALRAIVIWSAQT